MYAEPEVKKPEADLYDCGRCNAKVDAAEHGRRWSSEHKRWLCGPCFGVLVLGEPAKARGAA